MHIGSPDAPALVNLTRALNDTNAQIRAAAATTLGEIGPSAAKSLTMLRRLENDSEEAVVTAAARAIRRIDAASVDKTTLATPASATE